MSSVQRKILFLLFCSELNESNKDFLNGFLEITTISKVFSIFLGNMISSLVPGVVLIPLRIATKLSMTKSESIMKNKPRKENDLKIYQCPWELPATQHWLGGQGGQYGRCWLAGISHGLW